MLHTKTTRYQISPSDSKRIDYLKVIAIVMVVYIHSYNHTITYVNEPIVFEMSNWVIIVMSFFSHIIGSSAVPLFLLFSAIFLFKKQRDYLAMLKNKSQTLLVPFLFWNSFWILIFVGFQLIPSLSRFFDSEVYLVLQYDFLDWLQAYGLSFDSPFVYPLWYVRDLLVMTMISPIIYWVVCRFPNISLIIALVLQCSPIYLPFKSALIFFTIGAYFVVKDIKISDFDTMPLWGLFLVHIIFGFLKLANYVIFFEGISILAGVLFWLNVSQYLLKHSQFKNISQFIIPYVFFIYATHEYTLTGLKKIFERILPNSDWILLLQYLVLPIVIIVFCIIFAKIFQRIAPKIYNFVTGSH